VIDELLIGDEEHPPMTGFFVDSGFPDSGLTPLHWLIVEGHASVAQWFIDEGQVSGAFLLTSAELGVRDTCQLTPYNSFTWARRTSARATGGSRLLCTTRRSRATQRWRSSCSTEVPTR
jgi:hypothetical protein